VRIQELLENRRRTFNYDQTQLISHLWDKIAKEVPGFKFDRAPVSGAHYDPLYNLLECDSPDIYIRISPFIGTNHSLTMSIDMHWKKDGPLDITSLYDGDDEELLKRHLQTQDPSLKFAIKSLTHIIDIMKSEGAEYVDLRSWDEHDNRSWAGETEFEVFLALHRQESISMWVEWKN
jgi:hypothetical protein